MKCNNCNTIYRANQLRCWGCGYPRICDWCGKDISKHKKTDGLVYWYGYHSFHGKPPYPFNEGLTVKQKMSSCSLWYICNECYKEYTNDLKKNRR